MIILKYWTDNPFRTMKQFRWKPYGRNLHCRLYHMERFDFNTRLERTHGMFVTKDHYGTFSEQILLLKYHHNRVSKRHQPNIYTRDKP